MPLVAMMSFVGIYGISGSTFDLLVMVAFGVIGWGLRKLDIPLVPVIMGILLGNQMEANLRRALTISNGDWSALLASPLAVDPVDLGDCGLPAADLYRAQGQGADPTGERGLGRYRRLTPRDLGFCVSEFVNRADMQPRGAVPVAGLDLGVFNRSRAAGIASAYCGSHFAWATSISSTICQTSSGVQIAPTSGSCSTASFSSSTSPVSAAFIPMRWTLTLAEQVAAQAVGSVTPSTMLMPKRST